jgi:Flp pilus assembly protein TadD
MRSFVLFLWILILASPSQFKAQTPKAADKSLESYQAEALENGRQGRHEEAVGILRKLVSLKPNEASAHYQLGVELNATGLFAEATESLSRAIHFAPSNAEVCHVYSPTR